MNQIPITLTLYYPTAAQFEAYLGFMAMLSIAFCIFYVSLPAWHRRFDGYFSTGGTIPTAFFMSLLLVFPVFTFYLVMFDDRVTEDFLINVLVSTALLLSPVLLLIPFLF